MIVTFISQCQKKALNRTRRVLDAFADRIGDNTWQTIITEEGLITVKKLLRKTATKNTAVSCHWIRSRSRIDLVWIVGDRNKFNVEGIVPVNSTSKEVFMDVRKNQVIQGEFYANIHLQPLAEHLFAVGYISYQLFKNCINNDEHINLQCVAFLAGCFHDLGKIDPLFQEWVKKGKQKELMEDGQHIDKKFTFDKHPRHNEISLMLFNFFEKQFGALNSYQKEALQHVIYWHHAKPYRKNDDFTGSLKVYEYFLKNIQRERFEEVLKFTSKLVNSIQKIADTFNFNGSLSKNFNWNIEEINDMESEFVYNFKGKILPEFKTYSSSDDFENLRKKVAKNAHNNLLRACVISADRLVSALSAEDLVNLIDQQKLDEVLLDEQEIISNLSSYISDGLTKFPTSERSKKQNEIACKLADIRRVAVLAGAAGCGKTKIALEWAKIKNAQKIIWICPRVQICQGIFQELIDFYLPDATVEIFTGEFKYTNSWETPTTEENYFSGDVVVTTIDQILGSITTHTNVNSLLPFMDAYVVFDEYHEYIGMEIFNLLFAELIANKNMRKDNDKRTLLLSATPHYSYLKEILDINNDDIVEMPSFNNSQYKIEFIQYDEKNKLESPFYQEYPRNTIIISNTAQTAQLGFLYKKDYENSILFHSKYKRSDKKYLFDEVYESFKKEGTKKYDVLRAGPIIQASLNISCDHMVIEMTTPENFLQRLGRLDRFGKNAEVNVLKVSITDDIIRGKQIGPSAKFLASLNGLQTAKVWYEFLTERLDGKIFKLPELYQLYKEFYASSYERFIQQDVESAIKKSIVLLNKKITEPIKIVKKMVDNKKPRISKNSLRGDNRFVQLAKIEVTDYLSPRFLNEYAYQFPISEKDEFDSLTESIAIIQGMNAHGQPDSSKDLLSYMYKKHHNIIGQKKPYSDYMLMNEARDPEYPIYLSYIPEHLDKVGGESERHSQAIYYAVCDKQAIGTITLKNILTLTNNQAEE